MTTGINTRRQFLKTMGLAAATLAIPGFTRAVEKCKTKPNILIILSDDMGYGDVGYHGCKDIPTPNIDAFLDSGVRFTNGYVSGTYCSPTRAGLLTGRYQQSFGHEFNPSNRSEEGMPLTETTIADRLKAAGYTTGLVGKWHLGSKPRFHPCRRGFDEFFGFLAGGHSYFRSAGILRNYEQLKEDEYLTDAFGREAEAFIDRHQSKPWFLYLSFNAVHTPMHADEPRLKKFAAIKEKRRRTYAAMLFAMDEAIGRVMKKLSAAGLEKDTLVFFMPNTTINASSNKPLRGSKRTTLEGGVRVPFMVSWPGRIKPGVYEENVIQLDATVTALAAAGVKILPQWKLHGVNLLPFLSGQKTGAPHDALYWRHGKQMAIRMGDYKLVRYDTNVEIRSTDSVKLPISAPKLYRLSDDIGETKDLTAKMPDKAKELQKKWDEWNSTLMKPLWR
ncbi:MAG: sulfatase-like hydrolase/transferase [Planctomycetota bacterium]